MITGDVLATLATAEVVLDGRSWLRRPGDVFFRDSHSLADWFGPRVHERLIDRPGGLWRAMSAAGVRNLSDAAESRIVEQQPAGPGENVTERLAARRRLLLRMLAAEDHDAASKLEAFDQDVELHRLSRLVIQQALEMDHDLQVSEAYQRGALFLAEQAAILYVEAQDVPPIWVEIAREVARALRVDGSHASSVAPASKGLLAADSDDAALAELDELGFPALDESSLGVAEPNIDGDLGDGRVDGDDIVDEDTINTDQGTEQSAGADGGSFEEEGADGPENEESAAGDDSDTSHRLRHTAALALQLPRRLPPVPALARRVADRCRWTGCSKRQHQSRLRSYVAPIRDGVGASADASDADPEVERAGVDGVLEFERAHGREPEEMPPQNPGFDVRSIDADGNVRVIEVKSTADEWGPGGVAISSTQFASGQQRREKFWLYVVHRALTAPRVHAINDPATKL